MILSNKYVIFCYVNEWFKLNSSNYEKSSKIRRVYKLFLFLCLFRHFRSLYSIISQDICYTIFVISYVDFLDNIKIREKKQKVGLM